MLGALTGTFNGYYWGAKRESETTLCKGGRNEEH